MQRKSSAAEALEAWSPAFALHDKPPAWSSRSLSRRSCRGFDAGGRGRL